MQVKDLIQNLKKYHDPEDHVIVAYWEKDSFDLEEGESWPHIAAIVDSKMDWSNTHDDIAEFIKIRNEIRNEK
jgi:hypothetical protein